MHTRKKHKFLIKKKHNSHFHSWSSSPPVSVGPTQVIWPYGPCTSQFSAQQGNSNLQSCLSHDDFQSDRSTHAVFFPYQCIRSACVYSYRIYDLYGCESNQIYIHQKEGEDSIRKDRSAKEKTHWSWHFTTWVLSQKSILHVLSTGLIWKPSWSVVCLYFLLNLLGIAFNKSAYYHTRLLLEFNF